MTETPHDPEGQPGVSPDSAAPAAASAPGDSTTPATTPATSSTAGAAPSNDPFAALSHDAPAVEPASSETGPTAAYTAHTAPHAPQGASFGAAAVAGPPTTAAAGSAPRERRRSRLVVPLVAALAVGALIGGASGAGIVLATGANSPAQVVSENSGTSSNVVVNRASDATNVTAVAASASPSVVTIAVSGSSSAGTGSGLILSDDGYILTNTHVVTLDGAAADATIKVQTSDGKYWDATVVGTDPVVDLAVIKLTGASGLTPITWGDSSKLNVGDAAIAIGAPLGLSGTVTDGIISALNRSITVASSAVPDSGTSEDQSGDGSGNDFWNFDLPGESAPTTATASISLPVIQTDAAINPGNSGGALLNASGEIIGVNVAIASAGSTTGGQSGSIGVGFAIPSVLAKRVSSEIIANGSATHGLLGASVQGASTADDTSGIAGALVAQVSSGGAAQKAGLKAGDVITKFDGVAIGSAKDLTAQVRFLAAGSDATVTYVRDGKTYEATVTLDALTL